MAQELSLVTHATGYYNANPEPTIGRGGRKCLLVRPWGNEPDGGCPRGAGRPAGRARAKASVGWCGGW
jgi:hypothetical protein